MTTIASWYHCSVRPVSRSAGRSVVAAAAYRLGERLYDESSAQVHDYTRRSGVAAAFTAIPEYAPSWMRDPEQLWNAAEKAEKRINSTLAREIVLALPSLVEPRVRTQIARDFAERLVGLYGVAVSVAIHAPGRQGDQRNYHAHILFTTREVTPDGLGKKTRILDDRKTGPQQVTSLRAHACELINAALAEAGSDQRVDHRSFSARGLDAEPTQHLGPTASALERRGIESEKGEHNREVAAANEVHQALVAEVHELEAAIQDELVRLASAAEPAGVEAPPQGAELARAQIRDAAAPFVRSIRHHGAVHDIQRGDGLLWWQRGALRLADQIVRGVRDFVRSYWQDFVRPREKGRDNNPDLHHDR